MTTIEELRKELKLRLFQYDCRQSYKTKSFHKYGVLDELEEIEERIIFLRKEIIKLKKL